MANILVIRQGAYPIDPRVRREVTALLDDGHQVDLLCTRRPGERFVERNERLRVVRLPLFHRRGGAAGYVLEYLLFFLYAAATASVLHMRRRYRLVQVHTLPDSLVFAAFVPRLLGARVLLDLHECMPEFFASKFGTGPRHPVVRALIAIEQGAIRFAHHAITCTDQMRDVFLERGAPKDKIDVVLNSSEEHLFDPTKFPPHEPGPRFTVLCHGAIEDRYGLDTAIRAVALLAPEIPELRLEIRGEGSEVDALRSLAARLGAEDRVDFNVGYGPVDDLVAAVARADAGLVAVKRDPFRDLTQCNKMYDFIAMRRPAIVSRTRSVEAYFDEGCFAWFESGDEKDLARAIRALHTDRGMASRLVERAAERSEGYRWPEQRKVYLEVVRRLLG
jgi:glycosyltransferase involved in cell wall biosynthesis